MASSSSTPKTSPRGRPSEIIDIFIGGRVLYHPDHRQAASSFRWLVVDSTLSMIVWREEAPSPRRVSRLFQPTSSCQISALVGAVPGRMLTSGSEPIGDDVVPSVFSLVLAPGDHLVTFQARTVHERDMWLRGFQNLIAGVVNVQHLAHVSSQFQWSTTIGQKSVDEAFEIGCLLGKGSFAEVYRGCHRPTQFPMAIKIVRSTLARTTATTTPAIEEEEKLLLQSRHPNIVTYFGSLRDSDNRLWILTELCESGSIHDLLERSMVRLSEGHIATVVHEMLSGLSYLHDKHIVHNDIKCSNILLSADGHIKLADFGVSKQIDCDTFQGKSSRAAGTLLWMAPEVMSGRPSTSAADIWSMGITIIEMANDGKAPFQDLPLPDALDRIRCVEHPPPTLPRSSWSSSFHEFLALCLDRDPTTRPTAAILLQHRFLSQPRKTLTDIVQLLVRTQLNEELQLIDETASVRTNLARFDNRRQCIRKRDLSPIIKRLPLSGDLFE